MPLLWLVGQCRGRNWVVTVHGSIGYLRMKLSLFRPVMPGWSVPGLSFMQPVLGQPLKRVQAWVEGAKRAWAIL